MECSRRTRLPRLLLEHQHPALQIRLDHVALDEVAGEDLVGERVLDRAWIKGSELLINYQQH
jgi:hypothetical protein